MPFQVGIGFLGGTVFFQVGPCTPLETMKVLTRNVYNILYIYIIHMHIYTYFDTHILSVLILCHLVA